MLHASLVQHLAAGSYSFSTDSSASSGSLSGAAAAAIFIPVAILVILLIASMWKTFKKAGKPGWAAIVPFYNYWVLAEIAGKPGWWGLGILLGIIPVVGWIGSLVVEVIICVGVAKNFGKSSTFGVLGLLLFSFVGYPILGFGKATYLGPDAANKPLADPAYPSSPAAAQPFNPVEPNAPTAPQTPEAPQVTEPTPPAAPEQPTDNNQPPQPPTAQ